VLIALSSDRSSFAVAVEPSVHVLHRWAKPAPEKMNVESFQKQFGLLEESDGIDNNGNDSDDGSIKEITNGEHTLSPAATPPQAFLPCLSWGWALVSGGGNAVMPTLARAWGCSLQLLRANFPPNESGDDDESLLLPAFGVHDEFEAPAPVVALEWLGNRSLVYLTVTNEFTVIDTVMMTLLERLDFSCERLVYAEFSLSRSVATNILSRGCKDEEGDSKPLRKVPHVSTTFLNSIRTSDNRLLVLCQEELRSVSILGTRQRIRTLEEDGEWLEALALALDHYESTIKSLEDRKRDPDGRKKISNHPEFTSTSRLSDDEEWIADLLLRYLNLAVENAPEPSTEQPGTRSAVSRLSSTRIDLAQSHFQMLAGVCIEFCVVTRRLDLLFGPIFRRFQSVHYTNVFLDVLEPYVLNDKLHYIAPDAMAQFVEHCKASNDVATVERCLLHMDVTIMDFDSILSLLRKNDMYSALLHVFAHGLNDFITPLEILMEAIFDAADTFDLNTPRRLDGVHQNKFEQYGYKAILYLQHCFKGQTFPQGRDLKPEERVETLRPQILTFLQQEQYSPSISVTKSDVVMRKSHSTGLRACAYPYMHVLMLVDSKALLTTLTLALDAPGAKFVESESKAEPVAAWDVEVGDKNGETVLQQMRRNGMSSNTPGEEEIDILCPDRQHLVNILSSVVYVFESEGANAKMGNALQSQVAKDAFLDFMAKYLLRGVVRAPKSLTLSIISRMSSRSISPKDCPARLFAQDEVIQLLKALPRDSYDRHEVLATVKQSRMLRAALLLHKEGVTVCLDGRENVCALSEHFVSAIDCYLVDEDLKFRKEVFDYAKKECVVASVATSMMCVGDNKEATNAHELLRKALHTKLSDLVSLDAVLTAQLVAEIFIDDLDEVMNSLKSVEGGEIQFKFLHSIISEDLSRADPVAGQVLNANLSIDHHQTYLSLMAQFHPDMVYQHLSTHNNYRTEECLKLCQEYEIADASAYLLE